MTDQAQDLDLLATHYVRLVLAVGSHDTDYVDAYYGPPGLRDGTETMSLEEIQRQAAGLLATMRSPLATGGRPARSSPEEVSHPAAGVPRGTRRHAAGSAALLRRGVATRCTTR